MILPLVKQENIGGGRNKPLQDTLLPETHSHMIGGEIGINLIYLFALFVHDLYFIYLSDLFIHCIYLIN